MDGIHENIFSFVLPVGEKNLKKLIWIKIGLGLIVCVSLIYLFSLSLSFFPCDNAHLDLPALHAGSVNCNLILIWINKENPI